MSDAIVSAEPGIQRVICQRLPQHTDRVHHIPIGANVEACSADRCEARRSLRERLCWPSDAPVIAFFGFLHPVKGLETLLSAFRQVNRQRPGSRLLLVGGVESLALRGADADAYWKKLHDRAATLGIQQTVHFTGYQPAEQASLLLHAADAGVLPFNHGVSLKSGSLLALLAHGLPLVVTEHNPSVPELSQSTFVRVVPPRDEDALARELQYLVDTLPRPPQHAAEAGAFCERFSWASVARRHVELYETLLAAQRPR
jgi:glycosyltransferase involved in cell wall biosynthesis